MLKARMNDLSSTRLLVAHEIGHVLGLAFLKSAVGDDGKCYWEGERANALFGGKIPLGFACGHWDSAYFPNGVVSSLSLIYQDLYQDYQVYDFITDIEVAAVSDLGYTVDYTHAVPSVNYPSGSGPSGKVSAALLDGVRCLHEMRVVK